MTAARGIRTVAPEDLARLKRDREAADAAYNAALTAVDAALQTLGDLPHPPPGPDEHQITPLNQSWDLLAQAPAFPDGWKGRLARFVWHTMQPVVGAQQRFNSALVDHVNRSIPRERAVTASIAATIGLVRTQIEEAIRFQSHLVVYLQSLTPYVDTKDYEFAGIARRLSEDAQESIARIDGLSRGLAAALSGLNDELMKRYETLATDDQRAEARLEELGAALAVVQQTTNTLRRELSHGLAAAPAATSTPAAESPPPAGDSPQQMLASDRVFSQQYATFEDLYRGSEDEIRARMADYVPLFEGATDVVDIGCGRGEFLGLLHDAGITARGVDLNHEMVERSRARGFTVDETDALSFLSAAPPESLGGLIASQVVEHLEPDYLLRLLAAAQRALRPGATIVLETINPACWSAFFDSYVRDLTHVRPVHPDTLSFLVRAAGFGEVRVQGRSPYPAGGRLQTVPATAVAEAAPAGPLLAVMQTVDAHAERLNGLLFTDRDYAVIGRRP
ncbi:MAG: class I SAM-dependent methyltransferase [Vicinamibacterales bacterium]